ncbi:MAG: hypothetical protein R3B90_18695 [Planctomycetaceae bacterium]
MLPFTLHRLLLNSVALAAMALSAVLLVGLDACCAQSTMPAYASQPLSGPRLPNRESHHSLTSDPTFTASQAPPAGPVPSQFAEPAARPVAPSDSEESAVRATAISLNYCRASFHRIRKYPTMTVLMEEQEKILNNLNLQGIEDPEVIQLYTSVLDEINQIQVADRERQLTHVNHNTSVQRKITWDLVAFSTDLATAQYGNAVRQGANSWWDYRGMVHNRDSSLLGIEKGRMQSVTQKSSSFLDTFWKLARRKSIPDRWLVRADDLDALEQAQVEQDPEVRLRILNRMEPYMEAYPPFWYYKAKTEQELGELIAAGKTFQHVASLGDGHFRKDDMLASSLANLAAIQDHLGDPSSVMTARRALDYSTDVWEANLIAARILERRGERLSAEDAILRNLDVGLEREQSLVFLASLYYHGEERQKLARMLSDAQTVASLPAPVLLRCAACLGVRETPPAVMQTVLASLNVQPSRQFGNEELVVRLSPAWQLHLARLDVGVGGQRLPPTNAQRIAEGYELRYPTRTSTNGSDVVISFAYPGDTLVQVALQPEGGGEVARGIGLLPVRTSFPRSGTSGFKVAGITFNNTRIALTESSAERPASDPQVGPLAVEAIR